MARSEAKESLGPLVRIERHASKIYTWAIFEQFDRLLIEGTTCNVTEVEKMRKYVRTHNNAAKREKWSRVVYEVTVKGDGSDFECDAGSSSTLACCALMS